MNITDALKMTTKSYNQNIAQEGIFSGIVKWWNSLGGNITIEVTSERFDLNGFKELLNSPLQMPYGTVEISRLYLLLDYNFSYDVYESLLLGKSEKEIKNKVTKEYNKLKTNGIIKQTITNLKSLFNKPSNIKTDLKSIKTYKDLRNALWKDEVLYFALGEYTDPILFYKEAESYCDDMSALWDEFSNKYDVEFDSGKYTEEFVFDCDKRMRKIMEPFCKDFFNIFSPVLKQAYDTLTVYIYQTGGDKYDSDPSIVANIKKDVERIWSDEVEKKEFKLNR